MKTRLVVCVVIVVGLVVHQMTESFADDCDSSPCRHGGTCSVTTSGFECQCPHRYLGDFCERHDCVVNPCQNGAFCVTCPNSFFCPSITDRGFQCSCRSGFQGALCDLDVNECQQIAGLCKNGGTCVNTFGRYTCTCRQDYTGSNCETYAPPAVEPSSAKPLLPSTSVLIPISSTHPNLPSLHATSTLQVAATSQDFGSSIEMSSPVMYTTDESSTVISSFLEGYHYSTFTVSSMATFSSRITTASSSISYLKSSETLGSTSVGWSASSARLGSDRVSTVASVLASSRVAAISEMTSNVQPFSSSSVSPSAFTVSSGGSSLAAAVGSIVSSSPVGHVMSESLGRVSTPLLLTARSTVVTMMMSSLQTSSVSTHSLWSPTTSDVASFSLQPSVVVDVGVPVSLRDVKTGGLDPFFILLVVSFVLFLVFIVAILIWKHYKKLKYRTVMDKVSKRLEMSRRDGGGNSYSIRGPSSIPMITESDSDCNMTAMFQNPAACPPYVNLNRRSTIAAIGSHNHPKDKPYTRQLTLSGSMRTQQKQRPPIAHEGFWEGHPGEIVYENPAMLEEAINQKQTSSSLLVPDSIRARPPSAVLMIPPPPPPEEEIEPVTPTCPPPEEVMYEELELRDPPYNNIGRKVSTVETTIHLGPRQHDHNYYSNETGNEYLGWPN